MAVERTLSTIQPDAVERGLSGAIIGRFEKRGLKPVAIRLDSVRGSDAPETASAEIAYFSRSTEQHAYEWKR